jgi:hypothetical protein
VRTRAHARTQVVQTLFGELAILGFIALIAFLLTNLTVRLSTLSHTHAHTCCSE